MVLGSKRVIAPHASPHNVREVSLTCCRKLKSHSLFKHEEGVLFSAYLARAFTEGGVHTDTHRDTHRQTDRHRQTETDRQTDRERGWEQARITKTDGSSTGAQTSTWRKI